MTLLSVMERATLRGMNLRRPLAIITPTLDGDVLALLASGDLRLSGREISRRIGASQEGGRHVLERLVEQGIVLRERAAAAYLYRLNREHLAARSIEGLAAVRMELIERLRRTIAGWQIAPAAAVLFGSTARGDADEKSDIDLLVVRKAHVDAEQPGWRRQLARVVVETKAMTGNDTRLVEYSEAEVRRSRGANELLRTAGAEGVALAGSMRALVARGRKKRR